MDKKKIIYIILTGIVAILLGVAMIIFSEKEQSKVNVPYVEPDPIVVDSELLKSEHNYNDISFTDFVVRMYESRQEVSIKLQNNTDKKTEKGYVTLILFDSDGNELQRLFALLPEMEPGSFTHIGLQTSTDLSKIHDYKIIDRE